MAFLGFCPYAVYIWNDKTSEKSREGRVCIFGDWINQFMSDESKDLYMRDRAVCPSFIKRKVAYNVSFKHKK